jgi:hypothetical protein
MDHMLIARRYARIPKEYVHQALDGLRAIRQTSVPGLDA